MSDQNPAPGWYEDPSDPAQIRYWNGETWTQQVAPRSKSDDPTTAIPTTEVFVENGSDERTDEQTIARDAAPDADPAEGDLQREMGIHDEPRKKRPWILVPVVLLVIGAAAAFVLLRDDGDPDDGDVAVLDGDATSSTTTTTTTTEPPTTTTEPPTTTVEPEPEPVATVEVDAVKGMTSAEAEALLQDAGLDVEVVFRESSEFPPGTAMRTNPSTGSVVEVGSVIRLVVASEPSCNDIVRPLPAVTFDDYSSSFLSPGAEVLDAIAWAQAIGLASGNGDGNNFGRYDELTRELAAVLIHRYFCSPEPDGPPPQADVDSTGSFADAIAWVTERGIMGAPDRDFEPKNPTLRQVWYTALWRAFGSPETDFEIPYTDVAPGTWYEDGIRWASEEGIVPVVGTTFEREGWVFKQQAVVDLFRIEQIHFADDE